VIAKAQNTPLDKVRVLQRKLYLAAKTNPKRKFGVLYDKVCREDVLRSAYAQVRANRGVTGSLQVAELQVPLGCRCGCQVIF
jgi:RNA-directed DNA polymerase